MLDRLERTFYLGSYSKTLSSSLRVGFVAASAETIAALTRMKLLVTMTTSASRKVRYHEMLAGGHFRKHIARIRDGLDARRARVAQSSSARDGSSTGCRTADCSSGRAIRMSTIRSGLRRRRFAKESASPRRIVSAASRHSPWMRFNASCVVDPAVFKLLARAPCAREGRAAARR